MRRWTRLILVSLVLGAVVNVLLAWWAAYQLPLTSRPGPLFLTGSESGIGLDVTVDPVPQGGWRVTGRFGLPCRSMTWSYAPEGSRAHPVRVGDSWRAGLAISRTWQWFRLPLSPLTLGFLANSICYGALVVTVVWLSPWSRGAQRWQRARRRVISNWAVALMFSSALVFATSWLCLLATPHMLRIEWPQGFLNLSLTEYAPPYRSSEETHAASARGTPAIRQWSRSPHWWTRSVEIEGTGAGPRSRKTLTTSLGFPFHAVSSIIEYQGNRGTQDPQSVAIPAWVRSHLGIDLDTHLPLRPRPLAFIANVLIYTVVLLTLHAMWCEGRSRRRMRRGRCAACGYDIAGVERCPECGASCASDPPTA